MSSGRNTDGRMWGWPIGCREVQGERRRWRLGDGARSWWRTWVEGEVLQRKGKRPWLGSSTAMDGLLLIRKQSNGGVELAVDTGRRESGEVRPTWPAMRDLSCRGGELEQIRWALIRCRGGRRRGSTCCGVSMAMGRHRQSSSSGGYGEGQRRWVGARGRLGT